MSVNTNYRDVYAGNTATAFNTSDNSPVYVGYMYNDNDVYVTLDAYGNLESLDTDSYSTHLSDNNIDQETGRHVQNLKDSTIKGVIDTWYEENIKGKAEESLLEDTVWCNDRSVISETYSIENMANGTNSSFYFAAQTRLVENSVVAPSLTCARNVDKFTVESSNGNGDLDYPIGLLTADEVVFTGARPRKVNDSYLKIKNNGCYWLISPDYLAERAGVFYVNDKLYDSRWNFQEVTALYGARPAISLKNTALVTSGNGSYEQPYIIG